MNAKVRLSLLFVPILAGCAPPGEVAFRMHTINQESRFEGAGVLDVNRDGKLDIFCGGFWYEAPNWTKHFVRDIAAADDYFLDFSALPVDVDGDGWTDTICSAWHNHQLSWIRNPGPASQPFEEIVIDKPGNMETAMLADINGDGKPDVLPNIMGNAAWYELTHDASAPRGVKWIKHDLPKELAGHGMGAGDINGDGRCDVVGREGWAEQIPDGKWTMHSEFKLGQASIPIVVWDVDGDGDQDLVWGVGHDYGLYWQEQETSATGQRIWTQHEIDKSWSQAHVVLLGDVDGDGQMEIVTGKRYHAHKTDPGAEDPKCMYYYKFDRAHRHWRRHTIHDGGPAGTGTMTEVVDIDGDGDVDIVCPGKGGLYLLENLRQ